MSIASCGLWLPCSLRTNSIAIGTPAAAKAAESWEAGLPSGIVAMFCRSADASSPATMPESTGPTAALARATVTPEA